MRSRWAREQGERLGRALAAAINPAFQFSRLSVDGRASGFTLPANLLLGWRLPISEAQPDTLQVAEHYNGNPALTLTR